MSDRSYRTYESYRTYQTDQTRGRSPDADLWFWRQHLNDLLPNVGGYFIVGSRPFLGVIQGQLSVAVALVDWNAFVDQQAQKDLVASICSEVQQVAPVLIHDLHVRTPVEQELDDGQMPRLDGGGKRRFLPLVPNVNRRLARNERFDDLEMTFSRGFVQRRVSIFI